MRQLHRLWAWLAGYFWIPCPKCGEHFGGHEVADFSVRVGDKLKVVCKRCDPGPDHYIEIDGVIWAVRRHAEASIQDPKSTGIGSNS